MLYTHSKACLTLVCQTFRFIYPSLRGRRLLDGKGVNLRVPSRSIYYRSTPASPMASNQYLGLCILYEALHGEEPRKKTCFVQRSREKRPASHKLSPLVCDSLSAAPTSSGDDDEKSFGMSIETTL